LKIISELGIHWTSNKKQNRNNVRQSEKMILGRFELFGKICPQSDLEFLIELMIFHMKTNEPELNNKGVAATS
jgi:hypothetical protein